MNANNQRGTWLAEMMLVLTILQASSFTLTVVFRGPLQSDFLIGMVTTLWLAMYIFSAVGLFAAHGINWITWLVRYRLILTLLLTGTVFSTAWSVETSLTLERSIHLVGTTIVALYLGFSLPLSQMLKTSAWVLGLLMLLSIVASLLVPELGIEDYEGQLVWAGVLPSKNNLGFWAAITIILCSSLCFWSVSTEHRVLYVVIILLSLVCLFNSVSATSLLALCCAGLIMVYLHMAFSLRLSMLAMILLGGLVLCILGMVAYLIDTAELIGRSDDLTGRGEVWVQTWQLILERPLTGYGYGALWDPTPESLWIQQSLTDFSWTVYHAHNGFLQIASEIGLPLSILAVIMIAQLLIEIIFCHYQRQQPGVLFVLGFTVALLISNYSEARFLVNRELYWVFLIALPASMLREVTLFKAADTFGMAPGQSIYDASILRSSLDRKVRKIATKQRIKQRQPLKQIDSANMAEKKNRTIFNAADNGKMLRLKTNRRQRNAG